MGGRRGVGKTTLLHQFIYHQTEAGAAPEQFLYLPFDANPLYQLRPNNSNVQFDTTKVASRLFTDELNVSNLESGATVSAVGHADLPVVCLDNLLHDIQPEPGSVLT